MRLIPNAKKVALKSYSMWANYLGIVAIITPDLVYWLFNRDTSPHVWLVIGLLLILFGIAGRVIDQRIGDRS